MEFNMYFYWLQEITSGKCEFGEIEEVLRKKTDQIKMDFKKRFHENKQQSKAFK